MNTFPSSVTVEPADLEVTRLQEAYVSSVNQAVGADDLVLADELARQYDADVRELMSRRATLAA